MFDPGTGQWERLADTPISTGNFPSGAITFQNRYMILVGGYQYGRVLNPDGSLRPAYGEVTKYYPDNSYNSDVLVFNRAFAKVHRAQIECLERAGAK